jgi:hypothetical protein
MKATEFCYWLQGYFEIDQASARPGNSLSGEQVEVIQRHLALVFVYDIDPQAGPPEYQQVLNDIHSGNNKPNPFKPNSSPMIRC